MKRKSLSVLALALGVAACGGGEEADPSLAGDSVAVAEPMPTDLASPTGGGRVEIVGLEEGSTVGPDVPVVLRAEGVEVEPAAGTRVPGRGHHHLFVDTDPTAATESIPMGAEGIIHMGNGATEYTLTGLTPGEHRVIAVLAYGDHVPMEGVATDTVNFTVAAP